MSKYEIHDETWENEMKNKNGNDMGANICMDGAMIDLMILANTFYYNLLASAVWLRMLFSLTDWFDGLTVKIDIIFSVLK